MRNSRGEFINYNFFSRYFHELPGNATAEIASDMAGKVNTGFGD